MKTKKPPFWERLTSWGFVCPLFILAETAGFQLFTSAVNSVTLHQMFYAAVQEMEGCSF